MKKKKITLPRLSLDKNIIGNLGAGTQSVLGGASNDPICTPTMTGCTMFATCPKPNACF